MTEIKSSIERSDMNALDFEKSKLENMQEITIGNKDNMVTYLDPMITMMISMLTDKPISK